MTVVVVALIILTIMAAFALNFGYNRKKVVDNYSRGRTVRLYRAEGGFVDARARIRIDFTSSFYAPGKNPCTPDGSFTDDNYDPLPYLLDVDGDGVKDTRVDIGPVTNPTKQREIRSTACDPVPCV